MTVPQRNGQGRPLARPGVWDVFREGFLGKVSLY